MLADTSGALAGAFKLAVYRHSAAPAVCGSKPSPHSGYLILIPNIG
jgi:hypothetical protein